MAFCLFYGRQSPSKMRSIIKGKSLLQGQYISSLRVDPYISKGGKNESNIVAVPACVSIYLNLLYTGGPFHCWTSPFVVLGVSGLFYRLYSISGGKSC